MKGAHTEQHQQNLFISARVSFFFYDSEIFPSFHVIFHTYAPLNGFKQAQSGKSVMIINGMGPCKESLGMALCCWNLCLTAESARCD